MSGKEPSEMAGKTREEVRMVHSLWAVDRKEITVKGVRDVVSFDESTVDLVTSCGRMILEGHDLRVTVLDTSGGIVAVTGTLCGVLYEDAGSSPAKETSQGKRGRLSRLFR